MGFNNAQQQAIRHKDGPCMVLAGPGSGKTTVITRRVQYLIQTHKVNPSEILVVTFSKAASREMKERYCALEGGRKQSVTFGTFHGIYYGILKWAYELTSDNIFSDEQKYGLLERIVTGLELDLDDEKEFLQGIAAEISIVKNNALSLDKYRALNCSEPIFRQIYETYETERKRLRKIDFDDMLVLTYELFQNRPDILQKWQQKYRYILVDEFQDVNRVQYEVIRMLASPQNHLFVVGDDDQSIYRFRGSKPEIMLGFMKDYPKAKQILLDINYRSTQAIVSGAGRVIKHNKVRYAKKIITTNPQGESVHVQEVRHPVEESKYVVEEIRKALKRGVPLSEIAVLFRTNIEARTLVETFMEYHVPFQMREYFPNLYEHFIGRNIIAYLKMALGDRSRKLFLEIMNRPNRYISREIVEQSEISFEKLKQFYEDKDWIQDRIEQLEVDLKILSRCAPYGAIQYLRRSMGYDDFLREYAHFRRIRIEELNEILQEIEERAKAFSTIEEWLLHIEEYGEELRRQSQYQKQNEEAVSLMTMHGAKGLEFDTVFVISANEGISPYKKAETKAEIEEERRLFYVAMTRAKKRLFISYCREKGGKKQKASRFVKELMGKK